VSPTDYAQLAVDKSRLIEFNDLGVTVKVFLLDSWAFVAGQRLSSLFSSKAFCFPHDSGFWGGKQSMLMVCYPSRRNLVGVVPILF
jgi:hypothetical protein